MRSAMLLLFLPYLQLSVDGVIANVDLKPRVKYFAYGNGIGSENDDLNPINYMTSALRGRTKLFGRVGLRNRLRVDSNCNGRNLAFLRFYNNDNRRYLSNNWKETLSSAFGDNKIYKSNGLANAPTDGLNIFKKSVNKIKQFTDSNNLKAKQDWKKYGDQD